MIESKKSIPADSTAGTVQKSNTSVLMVIISLFFMWGFITCMNDILIPFLKKAFELSRSQSMLVQFSFFMAYFVGSAVYFTISVRSGDPIQKIGYKKGIIAGLLLSALGCILFYPAAEMKIYSLFLSALFILGLGFTLLQITANPYVAILGPAKSASSRLNLSQGFNSFGTTIAPIVGGYLIFHLFAKWGEPLLNMMGNPIEIEKGQYMSAVGVQLPYLIFAGIFILLAVLINFTKLPEVNSSEEVEKGMGALKYKHLVLGMVAIFMYVGGEVSIGSVLINYIEELLGYSEMKAKTFLAIYWGGAMIGRFLGAVSFNDVMTKTRKTVSMVVISLLTFILIYSIIYMESQMAFTTIAPFLGFIVLNLLAFKLGKSKASRSLMIFALVVVTLLCTTMLSTGAFALWCVLGIGLFNSIMWSNIFTLAIADLGKYTSQGSSLLVMMILGGAIMPLIQASVADAIGGYHYSFFVPIICYLYLAFYGWKGYKMGKTSIE